MTAPNVLRARGDAPPLVAWASRPSTRRLTGPRVCKLQSPSPVSVCLPTARRQNARTRQRTSPRAGASRMAKPTVIKPTHKAVAAYYTSRDNFARHHVAHESAVRSAFQSLLGATASLHHWTLIPELRMKVAGKTVIPDGTLKDLYNIPRGYWESKDEADRLDDEIDLKRRKGYPLTNTIFEDGRRAVLFQNGAVALDADVRDPQRLADVLNLFYAWTDPPIEEFNTAVA